ncbi:hypothetical protein BJ741DRAFT_637086 [Chytriomyces cf. hyalinus JEL632]|nr:hypothetical protein BJ741DRAFT_637086 [Chytriomyces cf. hyalinus JEL632]
MFSLSRLPTRLFPTCIQSTTRSVVSTSIDGWKQASKYMELDAKTKATLVPQPRGTITTPSAFLTAIGRSCADVSDKFKSWEHLFTATSLEMGDSLAIPVRKRRYILLWREWFKRGIEPRTIEIPKRAKKHLRLKNRVQLVRLKKQGLA